MGTPFITFLEPSKLEGYVPGAPRELQPHSIPSAFLDAMEVRERVFVQEQGVKSESEFDTDDSRSCHWVVYASVNKTEELEVRDEEGNVVQPRKSSTRSTPIGTIRLVPFPHEPHPKPGGHYYNGQLEGEPSSGEDQAAAYIRDRATTFHDGKEPYVKLGRLAVIPEFRGHRVAGLLVSTVISWLRNNPSYFDPSIKEMGLEQLGARNEMDIPKWNGLVCVHAQATVTGLWSKWGFNIDEEMGKWWEEGMAHVGMFQRIETVPKQVLI
ncbi:GCN5-related N-acetyltransferase (GNAT) domain protein [Sarocladium implicatum]|nr:GCN5-related N-acetyltransferase (GNAT) domain protein [Sarocladium implicatum]